MVSKKLYTSKWFLGSIIVLLIIAAVYVVTTESNKPSTESTLASLLNAGQISTEAHPIGRVDVHSLPEASGRTPEKSNVQPVHHRDEQQFSREKSEAESEGFVPPGQGAKVISIASTAPLAASSSLTFEGTPGGSPNPCGCSPPDSNIGVGPNHVFEMVNLAGTIYTKSGTIAKNTFPLSGFFNLSTSSMSDPEILYDAGSGRWFASIINIPAGQVQFAVSTNSDPTGIWNLYAVSTPVSSTLPDQPFIGVSDDKFVISANDFAGGALFTGVQFWVFNKTELVNGKLDYATNNPSTSPYTSFFSVHPAYHLGSSSGLFYMVSVGAGSTSTAKLFTVSGVPPNTVTLTFNNFAINPMSNPPNARQPGTSTTLATNDDRILSAVWQSNSLAFSATDACTPGGDTTTRSCARIIQITTKGTSPPTKAQDFDYASSGQYFFYPAVSLSQGQMVVAYGLSSSTVYPSLLVTGRASTDPVNTLQTPFTIRSGSAPDTSTRYGDYFGAATDPTPSASSTFWVAGEYRISSGFQNWNTAIAQVAAFGTVAPTPTPTPTPAPSGTPTPTPAPTPAPTSSLSVSANPSTITTFSRSTITASTSPSASGVPITFSTNLGSFNSTICTTGSTGTCSVRFRSSSTTGTAKITASASGYTSGSTNVTVTGGGGGG